MLLLLCAEGGFISKAQERKGKERVGSDDCKPQIVPAPLFVGIVAQGKTREATERNAVAAAADDDRHALR